MRFAGRLHRVPRARLKEAVTRAKQRCGVDVPGDKLIGTLSKGYQQRVGIAQAIVHEPDVVILDEPTIGLDPNQIREIRTLIRELRDQHSVILSTHILPGSRGGVRPRGNPASRRDRLQRRIEALRRFRGGQALRVGLQARRRASKTIKSTSGRGRALESSTAFFACCRTMARIRSMLWCAPASSATGGCHYLAPEAASLEDVFVQLTTAEEEQPT